MRLAVQSTSETDTGNINVRSCLRKCPDQTARAFDGGGGDGLSSRVSNVSVLCTGFAAELRGRWVRPVGMGIKQSIRDVWDGQVAGSGIAAGVYLVLLAAAWVWTEVVGFDRPDTLTGFLVWVYILLAVVVSAALLAGAAVRIIFLRTNRRRVPD